MGRLATFTFAALLVSGGAQARAQTPAPDRWQIETEQGDYLWDIRVLRLEGQYLVYREADTLAKIEVERIRELRLIQKTTLRLTDVQGGGGVYGALTGADDEVYDFAPLDFAARVRAIQQIFLRHPPPSE